MSKLKVGNKAYRTLDFILGARNPAVLSAMAPFGFTVEELTEGVTLLKAVTTLSLTSPNYGVRDQAGLVGRIDDFENTWFPVVRASLARHYPALVEVFFEELNQSQGKGTTIGLLSFTSRLSALGAGSEPYGNDGIAARELLASRGLTDEVQARAEALVEEISAVAPETSTSIAESEARLWAWYLEWSAIARVAIKSKSLLRGLGFGKRRRTDAESVVIEEGVVASIDAPAQLEAPSAAPALPAPEEGTAVAAE